jgi:hypothetical protein
VGIVARSPHLKDLSEAAGPHFVHRFVELRWVFVTEDFHLFDFFLPNAIGWHLYLFFYGTHTTCHIDSD